MSAPRVAICVPSYRRPKSLFALLGALDGLAFDGTPPEIQVVVVDNDAAGSAKPVCENARRWLRHPLRYVSEKRKGIPVARNAAVAAAWDSDWIAFVDDDETPEPRWLEELLRMQRQAGADVVTGPVIPRYSEPPPGWVVEGRFFESARHAAGEELPSAYTNNVLVRTARLAELPALFDERFKLGVGEDQDLFERIALAGGRIVWAPDAIVYDVVPPDRTNAGWLLRRGFRIGASNTHISRVRQGPASLPRVVAHAGWCVGRGLLRGASGAWRGTAVAVSGLQLASFGLGRLAGRAGLR